MVKKPTPFITNLSTPEELMLKNVANGPIWNALAPVAPVYGLVYLAIVFVNLRTNILEWSEVERTAYLSIAALLHAAIF